VLLAQPANWRSQAVAVARLAPMPSRPVASSISRTKRGSPMFSPCPKGQASVVPSIKERFNRWPDHGQVTPTRPNAEVLAWDRSRGIAYAKAMEKAAAAGG